VVPPTLLSIVAIFAKTPSAEAIHMMMRGVVGLLDFPGRRGA